MQTYIEDHWNPASPEAQKQEDALNMPLKANNLDLYYRNLHMNATTFINNMRTISKQLELRAISMYFLQFFFLRTRFFFTSNSTKTGLNVIESRS